MNTQEGEGKAALQCRKEAAPLSITPPSHIGYHLEGLHTQHICPDRPSPEQTAGESMTHECYRVPQRNHEIGGNTGKLLDGPYICIMVMRLINGETQITHALKSDRGSTYIVCIQFSMLHDILACTNKHA